MKSRKLSLILLLSLLLIGILIFTNLYYSPDSIWFIYPVSAIVWMVLTILLAKRNKALVIAISGAIMISVCAVCINLIFTPNHRWFLEAIFIALWWPFGVYIGRHPHSKILPILGSLLIIGLLITENLIYSSGHLWFLYAVFPVLLWPVIKLLPKQAAKISFAAAAALLAIGYYGALNLFYSPGYPWFIYPAFAVLWWPLARGFFGRSFAFSLAGSGLVILFFVIVNAVSSPRDIWAVYPAFAVLWWPLSVYYRSKIKRLEVLLK